MSETIAVLDHYFILLYRKIETKPIWCANDLDLNKILVFNVVTIILSKFFQKPLHSYTGLVAQIKTRRLVGVGSKNFNNAMDCGPARPRHRCDSLPAPTDKQMHDFQLASVFHDRRKIFWQH